MSCPGLADTNRAGVKNLGDMCPYPGMPGLINNEYTGSYWAPGYQTNCFLGAQSSRYIMYNKNPLLLADPLCCLDDAYKYKCKDTHCKGSAACKQIAEDHCTGDKIFNSIDKCDAWAVANPGPAANNMRNYCAGRNLESTGCIKFCADGACLTKQLEYCQYDMGTDYCKAVAKATGNGIFDTEVQKYCTTHLDDPFCSCDLRSLASIVDDGSTSMKIFKARPECYIPTCTANGYKNISQRVGSSECPPLSICDQNLNAAGVNSSVLTNVSLSCSTGASEPPGPPGTANPNTKVITINPTEEGSNMWIWIVGIVVLVLFAMLFTGEEEPSRMRNPINRSGFMPPGRMRNPINRSGFMPPSRMRNPY